jgi:hypothetical protein
MTPEENDELMVEFMEDYVDAHYLSLSKSSTGNEQQQFFVRKDDIIYDAGHRLLLDIPMVYSMIPKESSELHGQIKRLVDDMKEFATKPPNLYEILKFRSRLDNIAEECEVELERLQ